MFSIRDMLSVVCGSLEGTGGSIPRVNSTFNQLHFFKDVLADSRPAL